MADANPNDDICFNGRIFWDKEWVNLIRILLLGIATMVLIIPLGGVSIGGQNEAGQSRFTTAVKVLALPLYVVFGYSGGKLTESLVGRYKKELSNKIGI